MPTVFKPLAAAAVYLRKRAMDLGAKVSKGGVINEVQEIFILRAMHAGATSIVYAIEIPPYLAGPFGGRDLSTAYFSGVVQSNYGPLTNAIQKPTFAFEDITPVPTLKDNPTISVLQGGGRVAIGTLPAWAATRNALNATVGQFYAYPSSIMIPVSLTLDAVAVPQARSLLLTRGNGHMLAAELVPGLVDAGRPAINGDDAAGNPQAISAVEIAVAALGGSAADLVANATACLEWGALRGVASAMLVGYVGPSPTTYRLALMGYAITDAGVGVVPRFSGAASWQSDISATTVPIADRPDAITAEAAVAPTYTFPAWATSGGAVTGRAASAGLFDLPSVELTRMWAPGAGYDVPAETAMMVVQVRSGITAANFDAEGYTGDPLTPTYGTFSIPANQARKYISYVVTIGTAGAIGYTKLDEFVYARYDNTWFSDLTHVEYRPYLGINTFAGDPRLICIKRTNNYEIVAAAADVPGPPRIQGEIEHKALTTYNHFVRLSDLDYVIVTPAGGEVQLDVGAHYPPLYTLSTGAPGTGPEPSNGRMNYADITLEAVEPRYAQAIPSVFCQYAPGIVAALLSPVADFTSSIHTLRIGLFDVATGSLVALSPGLVSYVTNTRFSLSCVEQGTVDELGTLTAHAILMFTASTLSVSPTRGDGVFVVKDLTDVTWISREPSNVPAYYLGNRLVPATIGVSMNLRGIKPSEILP